MTTPEPIRYADFLADHDACFAHHRPRGWWAPFETADGFPEVLEYQAVRELLADDERLGAYLGGFTDDVMKRNPELSPEHIRAMGETNDRALINLDGEEHHRLRALVSRNFTPRSVALLGPDLAELARDLVARIEPGDDLMRGFARTFPARALCQLTGIPVEDHEMFAAWIDELEVQGSPEDLLRIDRARSERVLQANNELRAYIRDLMAQRRAAPRDDLLSRLLTDPEERADDTAIHQLLLDLIFAGNSTTRNAIGMMVLGLAAHPEIWESVAQDPSLAPAVVEEALRLHSAAPGPVRRACSRFEYRDRTFAEGEVSALSIWSANRDEAFWGPTAEEWDPDCPHAGQHLTFGHGAHFCLGASLAREELRAALVAMSAELTDVRIVEKPPMQPAGSIYGPISLKIAFERRATG